MRHPAGHLGVESSECGLGAWLWGGSGRKHQRGCQGSAAGQQRGKAGQRGSSAGRLGCVSSSVVAEARQRGSRAGRSGCASSSVVIEAAAAFIQLQWPLRWIAASAAESAALAAGAKLLAVLMGRGSGGAGSGRVQPRGGSTRRFGLSGGRPGRVQPRGARGFNLAAARLFHS